MFDRLLSKPDGKNRISAFSGLDPCDAGKLIKVDGVARNLHEQQIAWGNNQNTKMTKNGALRPPAYQRPPPGSFRPRLELDGLVTGSSRAQIMKS